MPYKCAAHAGESESDDEAVGYCCDRCCRFEKSRKIREGREAQTKIPLIFWRTGESCRCELRTSLLVFDDEQVLDTDATATKAPSFLMAPAVPQQTRTFGALQLHTGWMMQAMRAVSIIRR